MTALWVTISILALVIALFSIHIKVRLYFSYNEKGNEGEIEIKYLFLRFKVFPKAKRDAGEEVKEKSEKPQKEKKQKKKPDIIKYFEILTEIFDDLKNGVFSILGYVIHHAITVNELNISAKYGTGDPMYTGILTGVVNGVVYNIIGMLSRNGKLKKWDVNLKEDFDDKVMSAGVFCILSTNVLHILALGAIIIRIAVKILFKIWRMRRK